MSSNSKKENDEKNEKENDEKGRKLLLSATKRLTLAQYDEHTSVEQQCSRTTSKPRIGDAAPWCHQI